MSKYEFLIALFSIVTGGVTMVSIVSAISRVMLKRGSPTIGSGVIAGIDERLMRMEQAIDAMAVEMERVSEGQRFTTKLLSEREPAREQLRDGSREAPREHIKA